MSLALVRGQGVTLYTRHETNCTYQYPELQIDLGPHVENAVLDGEMICLHQGKPSFEDVMTRFLAKKESTIQRLAKTLPAHYVAFDLLFLNGQKVTNKPLMERLEMLSDVVVPSDVISICPSHTDGAALFKSTVDLGLEGIVSKLKNSRWIADTRSNNWLKVKNYQYAIVEIAGMRKGDFGWLIKENGVYKGVCEFVPSKERSAFYRVAREIITEDTPNWTYIQPVFRCKVKYQCLTRNGQMRSPSFVEFVFPNAV